ncbi:hypothetical protein HK101_002669 [Irineochytrium annulatum]|nr:hypothetical protein HK101_002669 [Irineochytrium annulatum]
MAIVNPPTIPSPAISSACGGLFSNSTSYKGSEVLACFNAFPITSKNISDFVSALKYYLPFAANVDLLKSNKGVDLGGLLDGVAADGSVTNEFQMHGKIVSALTTNLPWNAGYGYSAGCFSSWVFLQPWTTDLILQSTGPAFYLGRPYADIKIEEGYHAAAFAAATTAFASTLNGNPAKYVGYQITSINGQDPAVHLIKLSKRSGYFDSLNVMSTRYYRHDDADAIDGERSLGPFVGLLTAASQVYDSFYQSDVTYTLKGPSGDTVSVTVPWQAIFVAHADFGHPMNINDYYEFYCVAADYWTALRRRNRKQMAVRAMPNQPAPKFVGRRDSTSLQPLFSDNHSSAFYMVTPEVGVWAPKIYITDYDVAAWPNNFASFDHGVRALSTAGAKTLVLDLSDVASAWVPCAGSLLAKYFFGAAALQFEYDFAVPYPKYLHNTQVRGRGGYGEMLLGIVSTSNTSSFGTLGYNPVRSSASVSTPVTVRGTQRSPRFTVACDIHVNGTFQTSPFAVSSLIILSNGICFGACAEFVYQAQQQKVQTFVFGTAKSGGLATYAPATFTAPIEEVAQNYRMEMVDMDGTDGHPADDQPFVTYSAYLDFPSISVYLPGTPEGDAGMPVDMLQAPIADAGVYLPVKNVTDTFGIWTALAGQMGGTPATFADGATTPSAGAAGGFAVDSGSSSKPQLAVIIGVACGAAVLIIIAGIVAFLIFRRNRAKKATATATPGNASTTPNIPYGVPQQQPFAPPPQNMAYAYQAQNLNGQNGYGQQPMPYLSAQPPASVDFQPQYVAEQPAQGQDVSSDLLASNGQHQPGFGAYDEPKVPGRPVAEQPKHGADVSSDLQASNGQHQLKAPARTVSYAGVGPR